MVFLKLIFNILQIFYFYNHDLKIIMTVLCYKLSVLSYEYHISKN